MRLASKIKAAAIIRVLFRNFTPKKRRTSNLISLPFSVLDYPAYLLQVDKAMLAKKLTSRIMESKWGAQTERLDVTCNVQQSESTRDALAKGLYSRLFDYLVKVTKMIFLKESKIVLYGFFFVITEDQ